LDGDLKKNTAAAPGRISAQKRHREKPHNKIALREFSFRDV
jgi:hypothetical protein